eukprot:Clim_evm20s207 gene=Clim_evmTU20s207
MYVCISCGTECAQLLLFGGKDKVLPRFATCRVCGKVCDPCVGMDGLPLALSAALQRKPVWRHLVMNRILQGYHPLKDRDLSVTNAIPHPILRVSGGEASIDLKSLVRGFGDIYLAFFVSLGVGLWRKSFGSAGLARVNRCVVYQVDSITRGKVMSTFGRLFELQDCFTRYLFMLDDGQSQSKKQREHQYVVPSPFGMEGELPRLAISCGVFIALVFGLVEVWPRLQRWPIGSGGTTISAADAARRPGKESGPRIWLHTDRKLRLTALIFAQCPGILNALSLVWVFEPTAELLTDIFIALLTAMSVISTIEVLTGADRRLAAVQVMALTLLAEGVSYAIMLQFV